MSHQTLRAGNAAHQHAKIPSRRKQGNSAYEKKHSNRNPVFHLRWATCHLESIDQQKCSELRPKSKPNPTKVALPAVTSLGIYPCRCHKVEGLYTADNVARLMF